MKPTMRHNNLKLRILFLLLVLLSGCVLAVQSSGKPEKLNSVPAIAAVERTPIVRQICSEIYQGNFTGAGQLLADSSKSADVNQLAHIISEYEAVQRRRQEQRKVAYEEQLAELTKLQTSKEPNDVNDTIKALSVIAETCELADERQKEQILARPFANRTFTKALNKAAQFESEGKWLDSYLSCYTWLQSIDKDNKSYSDHAKQLLIKANIVASFSDSPCETSKQRFDNIKKRQFSRAIDILDSTYVSKINDYNEMTVTAVKRCQTLADVIKRTPELEISDSNQPSPTQEQWQAWSQELEAIDNEVKSPPARRSKKEFINVLDRILALNEITIKLPRQLLIAQFAESSLSSLDPYTVMVWPYQTQDFKKLLTHEFTRIGIEINKRKGLLTVASLLPDTPAYNSGLDAGDVISAVEDVETRDMSLICAVKNITGPAGTKVRLTIQRPDQDESFDITIKRAKITVPTIRGWQRTETGKWLYVIDEQNRIGYVRLTSFSEGTSANLEKVLSELETQGLNGLILDLRFNTGGLLSSAVDITNKFIKKGIIVSTRPRFGLGKPFWASKRNTHPDYPLVILINRFSASASEIVAGALADDKHNRAVLVGQRTHGKGSVQGIAQHLGSGAQLKYTIAHYYLPSNQRVESRNIMEKLGKKDWGVAPDVKIVTGNGTLLSDEETKTAKLQKDNDVLFRAGHDNGSEPLKRHSIEETLSADPQLAVGMLVIKTKLVENR